MNNAPASPAPLRTKLHWRVWLLAAMVFVLIRSIPNLTYPIGRDQATYLVIGRGLLEGQQLYRDLWDNKPPGIFYLYALIVKVFGPVMWCVGLVDILWLLVISYLIFRFAARYLGPGAAFIAVTFNASWHVWTGYWEAAQTETFLMLFVLASFFAVARDGPRVNLRHCVAGALFAVAFWLKYNALAMLPLVILLPYFDTTRLDAQPRRVSLTIPWQQWLKRSLFFGAGFGAVAVAVLAQFWVSSSWAALMEVQFEVLPRYSAMALERTPYYPLWALSQTEFVVGPPTEIATLLAFVVAWRQRDLARFAPVFLGLATGYLSTALQVRFHAYAFETCYPFFAMMWGYLAVKIYRGFRTLASRCAARGWRLARVLVWILLANVAAWPLPEEAVNIVVHYKALGHWWRERDLFYAGYPWPNPISHFPDQMRVIAYLRHHSRPGDSVFVWGSEPLIYFLTESRMPTRFISNLALVSPWSPPAWRDELVRDLRQAPPRYLVVARDDEVPFIAYTKLDSEEFLQVFPELAIFLADYYEPAKEFENFRIYRLKDLPAGNSPSAVGSLPKQ